MPSRIQQTDVRKVAPFLTCIDNLICRGATTLVPLTRTTLQQRKELKANGWGYRSGAWRDK